MLATKSCADPGFFSGGGGAGMGVHDGQRIFFYFHFVPNLFYSLSRGSTTFPRIQRGLTFSRRGGGPTFSREGGGGVLIIISKETHITCDFLGGGGVRTPYPPSGSAHAKFQFRSVLSHAMLERRPSPVRVSPYSH